MSSRTDQDAIFTVVSRPGPVEARILQAVGPELGAFRRIGAGVALRTLESVDPGPPGPTIVFLHGRGHAATVWAPVARRFATTHRVLVPDLPGFGHSGAGPLQANDPDAGLAFFREPIEGLLHETSPLILVGHSLGGFVALDIALRRRVLGLVLVDAMGLSPIVSVESRLYLRTGPERLARARSFLSWTGGAAHEGPSQILDADEHRVRDELGALRSEILSARGGRPLASRAFNTMLGFGGVKLHHRERLHEIEQPVLLLWGENDEAFPLPIAIDARTRFPNATLETLPTGHSPHLEAPLRVAGIIERFVSMLSVAN